MFYVSILQVCKVLKAGTPLFLFQHLHTEHPYPARQATDEGYRYNPEQLFWTCTRTEYNSISEEIRATATYPTFIKMLRVKENFPIE